MQDWLITAPATVSIPARAARALLNDNNGTAALLYLHMQLNGGRLDTKLALTELSLTEDQLSKALTALQRLCLADVAGATTQALQSDKRPDYSPAELTDNLNGDKHFKQLTEDVSRKLGKILSNNDLATLLGLYSWLGLPADVISLLVVHCMDEAARRFGNGRLPTLRQIEKTAIQWEKQGLVTPTLAEAWVEEHEKARQSTTKIARVLQITGRALTTSEETYVQRWITMGFTPELIYLAYDRTIMRCGRMEWKYMDVILQSWHSKGLLTQEAIEGSDVKPPRAGTSKGNAGEWQPGEFEKQAVANMKKYRNEKGDA